MISEADLRELRRADTVLTECVRKGMVLEPGLTLGVVRRLFGWTGTLLRHAAIEVNPVECKQDILDIVGHGIGALEEEPRSPCNDKDLVRAELQSLLVFLETHGVHEVTKWSDGEPPRWKGGG